MKLQHTAFLMIGLMASQAMAEDQKPAAAAAANTPPAHAAVAPGAIPTPDREAASYALGQLWGTTLKRNVPDLDIDIIVKAMKDVLAGTTPRYTDREASQMMNMYAQAVRLKAGEKNKTDGEAFMAKNGKEPGVVTLPNGLQYTVMTEGTGPMPKATDTVVVNYRGTLINGTEFDSSYKRNEPFTTPVTGRTIKGWSEILPLMKVGSKWKVVIPASLAYGERGTGGIEPNSTLIFEMELLSIKEPVAAAQGENGQVVSGEIIKVPSAEDLKKGAKPEVIKVAPTNSEAK